MLYAMFPFYAALTLATPSALAGPATRPQDLVDFATALRAQGDFIVPAPRSGTAPPAGNGSNKLDVYRYGDLALLHDPDGEWFSEATTHVISGDINWILDSTSGAFYKSFDDDYDFVTLMMVRDLGMFFAFYSPLSNEVYGIGYDSVTPGEVFDQSSTKLQGYIFMNYYGLWSQDPEVGRYVFNQEFMHRWGSFVNVDHADLDSNALLGRDVAHWSYWFNTTNSPMEGNAWLDNGDATWTVDPAATSTYSDLDLYLMGLVGPEAVAPQTVLLVDDAEQERVGRDATATPEGFAEASAAGSGQATSVTAQSVVFTVDDIIAAEGARVPSVSDSPKTFKMAFLVLVLSDDAPDEAMLAEIDTVRRTFEADWEADVQGLADLDTTLGAGDAPTWGASGDSGDSADSATTDSGPDADAGPDDAEDKSGCGCATSQAPQTGALVGIFGALLGLASLRRRRA